MLKLFYGFVLSVSSFFGLHSSSRPEKNIDPQWISIQLDQDMMSKLYARYEAGDDGCDAGGGGRGRGFDGDCSG